MSRDSTEGFFLHAADKTGYYSGRRLLVVNPFYEGNNEKLTVADLAKFLHERNIDLSSVVLPPTFTAVASE